MGKSRIIGGKSAARPRGDALRNRQSRGSALVEAALLLPVMFLMLFGTMDFGRVYFTGMAVASAARAGVQYGSLGGPGKAGDAPNIRAAVQADASNQGLVVGNMTITPQTYCQCVGDSSAITNYNAGCTITSCSAYGDAGAAASYVEVTVAYTFSTLVNWPGVPRTTNITRTARMRVQ
jgi:Flp pilus assembly protein TadG